MLLILDPSECPPGDFVSSVQVFWQPDQKDDDDVALADINMKCRDSGEVLEGKGAGYKQNKQPESKFNN